MRHRKGVERRCDWVQQMKAPLIMVKGRGGVWALAAVPALLCLLGQAAWADPIAVRFPQGMSHGFLLVHSLSGEPIGQGEVTQIVNQAHLVESHLRIDFKDGSLHDETVVFSQQRVFTLIRYHLTQQGPLFSEQLDASIDRQTGTYQVRWQDGRRTDGETVSGEFELPNDVYNGMLVTVLVNLPSAASERVQIVSFTPRPQLTKLELRFQGEQTAHVGDQHRTAHKYVFKPDIGKLRLFFGRLLGKLPDDFHYACWILADEVPSLVRFEGPLQLKGPVLHIELVSPALKPLE